MTTLHTSGLKKGKVVKIPSPLGQPNDCTGDSQSLSGIKRGNQKNQLLKRISPFLIVEVCLPFLFTYAAIRNVHNAVWLFFLLVFSEMNIMVIDFALWNYHNGRKILRIWIIELSVILLALYILI